MALSAFSTPGSVTDLSAAGRAAWSRDVAALLDRQVAGGDHPQFFNQLNVPLAVDATTKVMRWGAFPRKLAREVAPRRWTLGEERNRQEEYCEWAAERDRQGRITRAFFTTEVPSYYHRLANDAPKKLLAVYRKHVSAAVQPRDLIRTNGSYNPGNVWNRQGAMHMIQGANTLDAAVILVAQATVVRTSPQGLITNANELIRCGVGADADRNSDPLIVGDVNTLARTGAGITLEDPIGLYIDSLQTAGWTTPDGSDPASFWTITRGDRAHAVRAVYAVPPGRGFLVSDITIGGRPIVSPSQIAERIQIRVNGLAHNIGKTSPVPRPCGATNTPQGGLEALSDVTTTNPPSMEELVERSRAGRG